MTVTVRRDLLIAIALILAVAGLVASLAPTAEPLIVVRNVNWWA